MPDCTFPSLFGSRINLQHFASLVEASVGSSGCEIRLTFGTGFGSQGLVLEDHDPSGRSSPAPGRTVEAHAGLIRAKDASCSGYLAATFRGRTPSPRRTPETKTLACL